MIPCNSIDRSFPIIPPFSLNPKADTKRRSSHCSHQFQWRFPKFSRKSLHPPKFRWNRVGGDASPKLRVVSSSARAYRDGGFDSLLPESELQRPSLLEFVTSERVKVVAMLGLALALCNADRVVMSVAIVPLSKARGWSQSFSGVVQIYEVDLRQAAWFSALPWVMMAILGYAAGAMSDMLIQMGRTVTFTRKLMQSIGFIGPGLALLGLNAAKSPSMASAWLTAAVGLSSFSHSGFLVNLQEIAPQYAGVLHGMSNTAGTLAAIVGTIGAGYFVEKMGSFRGFLMLTSFLYFAAALFWGFASTGERVDFGDDGQ